MEKECQICGGFFTTTNKLRKLCDDCSAHYNSRRREYDKAIRDSIRNNKPDPKVLNLKCYRCGTEFKTISKLVISFTEDKEDPSKPIKRVFCSEKCKNEHRIEYFQRVLKCRYCGTSLVGSKFFIPRQYVDPTIDQFCCQEHKDAYKYQVAKAEGRVHTCEYCGKEFIRKNGHFCSNDCYKKAIKNGWKDPDKKEPPKFKNIYRCKNCGKQWIEYKDKQQGLNIDEGFCSQLCKEIYESNIKNNTNKIRKVPSKRTEQLCASCKVSYKDCERMQSNFRILPKGAHYNSNGILTVCPKYKS